jgi:hypothetical protein
LDARVDLEEEKMSKRTIAALVAAAAIAAAAGVTYAATTGDGVVKACAGKVTGNLRLETGKGCLPFENAVQWNEAGPVGPQGPQGPAGTSDAEERYYVASSVAMPSTFLPVAVGPFPAVFPSMTRIVTLHVPAGNYAIASQITAANENGIGIIVCLLHNGVSIHGFAQAAIGNEAGYSIQQTMTMAGALSLAQDTDIDLSCSSSPVDGHEAGTPAVVAADIATTKVDTASITQEVH